MTPRSFWTILIKLLGVYIILQSFTGIPNFLTSILFFTSRGIDPLSKFLYLEFIYYVIVITVYVIIFSVCIFKTDWIIDTLHLDEGYDDERFEFTIHRSTLLKIVIMAIGGYLIVESVPMFCQQLLAYYKQRSFVSDSKFSKLPLSQYVVVYLIKIVIGYFMLSRNRAIVNFIEWKRKDTALESDETIE